MNLNDNVYTTQGGKSPNSIYLGAKIYVYKNYVTSNDLFGTLEKVNQNMLLTLFSFIFSRFNGHFTNC